MTGAGPAAAPASQPFDVLVLGSINVDHTISVPVLPEAGQTVPARGSALGLGGKGLNQAVAVRRSGATTALLAAVGADQHGDAVHRLLLAEGITPHLRRGGLTGTAFIHVDQHGENFITTLGNANDTMVGLTVEELNLVATARVLLMQCEIPVETILAAAGRSRAAGGLVVLNAAPVVNLPPALPALVDVLVVNEHEARDLYDTDSFRQARPGLVDACSVSELAVALRAHIPLVAVTLGPRGVVVATPEGVVHVDAVPAPVVVDTTGAGDTWCGALASRLAAGAGMAAAASYACAAASLSVAAPGAVASIPRRADVLSASAGSTSPPSSSPASRIVDHHQ